VANFRSVALSESIQRQFAERALALRYDRPKMAPIRATAGGSPERGCRTHTLGSDEPWARISCAVECGTPAE
jgi:hypothetical protein